MTQRLCTPPGTGQWYWEFVQTARSGTDYTLVGMLPRVSSYVQGLSDIPQNVGGIGLYIGQNGVAYVASGAATAGTTSATFDVGDILGWAFDAENGTVKCYKNGVAQGTQFTNVRTDIGWTFCVTDYDHNTVSTYAINFGQRPFKYTPPTGYKSLCTTNLPEPTIVDGSKEFDALLYTGDGQSSKAVTGYGFSPDLLWIKERSSTSDHGLWNTVVGSGKYMSSNNANAQVTTTTELNSIDSAGFTVGSSGMTNQSSQTYVAWAWDAGSSNTTLSAGGLNSSVYDQSQTWSNSLSASFRGSEPATNAFDGDTSTIAGSGGSITYTSPVAVASNSTIRVFVHGGDHNVSVNGGANQTVAAGSFVTLNFTNPTNSTFTITFDRVGTADTGVRAIEIGGKLLVDYGVSVANVPTIASTVRANPSAGFSIVNYSSSSNAVTVGHGLNAAPEFIILKDRNNAYDWIVITTLLANTTDYLVLNSSAASANFAADAPTSTTFTPSQSPNSDYIAYCFAPVEGYSAFGKFSGNSSTDGPFQYCGFKPRFLLLKGITQSSRSWIILDTERDAGNVGDSYLHPDSDGAENTYAIADILSNGFKMRYAGGLANQTGEEYLWAAFAEHPFKNSRAR